MRYPEVGYDFTYVHPRYHRYAPARLLDVQVRGLHRIIAHGNTPKVQQSINAIMLQLRYMARFGMLTFELPQPTDQLEEAA